MQNDTTTTAADLTFLRDTQTGCYFGGDGFDATLANAQPVTFDHAGAMMESIAHLEDVPLTEGAVFLVAYDRDNKGTTKRASTPRKNSSRL